MKDATINGIISSMNKKCIVRNIFNFVIIYALIVFSCEKSESSIPACNVDNPLVELEWLKDVKNSLSNCNCQISILQGKYSEKTVFYLMNTDPACNSKFHVVLWDCNGNVVKEYELGENNIFYSEVELVENIYTCSE